MKIIDDSTLLTSPFVVGILDFKFSQKALKLLRTAIETTKTEELTEARIGSKLSIDDKTSSKFMSSLMMQDGELARLLKDLNSIEMRKRILSKLWLKMILCRKDRYVLDILLYKFFGIDRFNSRIEISVMEVGSFIPPHVDSKRKIFSGMIYLPSKEQDESDELGTEFWDYNRNNYNNVHLEQPVDLKDFEESAKLVCKPTFDSSKMFYFLRNAKSWHSVSKVRGSARLSLNYNIEIEQSLSNSCFDIINRYMLRRKSLRDI